MPATSSPVAITVTCASAGDPINQAGLIDVGCQDRQADYVATLSDFARINGGDNVDAAIAEVLSNRVSPTGEILVDQVRILQRDGCATGESKGGKKVAGRRV